MENLDEIRERYGSQVKEKAEQAKNAVNDAAQQAKTAVSDAAEQARTVVTDAAQEARARTEEIWETTLTLIRENPGKSVGVAFLVGLALGALVSGGSDEEETPLSGARKAADESLENWQQTKASLAQSLDQLRCFLDEASTKLKA